MAKVSSLKTWVVNRLIDQSSNQLDKFYLILGALNLLGKVEIIFIS